MTGMKSGVQIIMAEVESISMPRISRMTLITSRITILELSVLSTALDSIWGACSMESTRANTIAQVATNSMGTIPLVVATRTPGSSFRVMDL